MLHIHTPTVMNIKEKEDHSSHAVERGRGSECISMGAAVAVRLMLEPGFTAHGPLLTLNQAFTMVALWQKTGSLQWRHPLRRHRALEFMFKQERKEREKHVSWDAVMGLHGVDKGGRWHES